MTKVVSGPRPNTPEGNQTVAKAPEAPTLVAHLAREQEAADSAEPLVIGDRSGGGVRQVRRGSRLQRAAGYLHQSARALRPRRIGGTRIIIMGDVYACVTPLQDRARRGR